MAENKKKGSDPVFGQPPTQNPLLHEPNDESDESADDGDLSHQDSPSKATACNKNARRLDILLQDDIDEESRINSDPRQTPHEIREIESQIIIDKARDYQQELFERAKDENVIAVLDTGTGKTLIAAMLIRHVLEQQVLDKDAGKPSNSIFFLAHR